MRSLGDIAKIRTFSTFEKMAGKLILHVISPVYEQIVSKCKKITLIVCLRMYDGLVFELLRTSHDFWHAPVYWLPAAKRLPNQ